MTNTQEIYVVGHCGIVVSGIVRTLVSVPFSCSAPAAIVLTPTQTEPTPRIGGVAIALGLSSAGVLSTPDVQAKAQRILGYAPKHHLAEGIATAMP